MVAACCSSSGHIVSSFTSLNFQMGFFFGCCAAGRISAVMIMLNHCHKKVVCMLEQLIELSKAQVRPEIRPQIPMSWRGDVKDAKNKTKWRQRRKKFKPFLLLIIMEAWDHWWIKMDDLEPGMRSRSIREAIRQFFIKTRLQEQLLSTQYLVFFLQLLLCSYCLNKVYMSVIGHLFVLH